MNWDYYKFWKKQEEEKKSGALKAVLITVGIIAAVTAAAIVVYNIFKKYFTITFECDDCDDCCFDECCEANEPICCYEGEDECDAPEAAAEA